MTDTTDGTIINTTINSQDFQTRVRLRFISAAISITTELPSTADHDKRLAFAGALFGGKVDLSMLCMTVLSASNIRTKCLADPSKAGGTILDSEIDTQIGAVFTGLAVSQSWLK